MHHAISGQSEPIKYPVRVSLTIDDEEVIRLARRRSRLDRERANAAAKAATATTASEQKPSHDKRNVFIFASVALALTCIIPWKLSRAYRI